MKLNANCAYAYGSYNTTQPTTNNKIKNSNLISFEGHGKTKAVVAGIASGLLIGYYASMANILPTAVNSTAEKVYLHNVELKAISAVAENDEITTNELIEEMLKRTESKPNNSLTQGIIKIIDNYDLLDESASEKLEETIKKASFDKKLNNDSLKFYNSILDNE